MIQKAQESRVKTADPLPVVQVAGNGESDMQINVTRRKYDNDDEIKRLMGVADSDTKWKESCVIGSLYRGRDIEEANNTYRSVTSTFAVFNRFSLKMISPAKT